MATLMATPLFDSLRGKYFFLSRYDPTLLICIDTDARYPMFRDSYSWRALTVLTRLFSQFDDDTTISDFLLSRILHLLDPSASEQLLLVEPHLATLWFFSGQDQVELQTFGCAFPNQGFGEDWPRHEVIFPLPIHYAATAGNVDLVIKLVGAVGDKEKYVRAGLGIGSCGESGGSMSAGDTSLHLAVAYNRFDVVVYLVTHFPRLVIVRNVEDEYPVEMIGARFERQYENQNQDWCDETGHKILWWLLRTNFTGWMLSKETGEVVPRGNWFPRPHGRRRTRYRTVREVIKAKFTVTPEMADYLTPMSTPINCTITKKEQKQDNPMSGKINEMDEKQATGNKKIDIEDIMKERPHNAMCNHMYLLLMLIFRNNCPGREVGELTVCIMTFAFRNAMDMIMPISMAPKYLYLGSTRIELDQQEEYEDEQEKCEEKSNYEFIWPASFDNAGCQDDAEQEECPDDDSSEDSAWWV